MAEETRQIDASIRKFLGSLLEDSSESTSLQWLQKAKDSIESDPISFSFFTTFSTAIRYFPHQPLMLRTGRDAEARSLVPGWNLKRWTYDQAARAVLILSLPLRGERLAELLRQAFGSAEANEAVALGKALPLLPDGRYHTALARLGCRSNAQPIFESIAHWNAFPSRHFEEESWNQMILKALFIQVPLRHIVGLDARANAKLVPMLLDFATERKKAKRTFSPELFRLVIPWYNEAIATRVAALVQHGTRKERLGAALSFQETSWAEKARMMDRFSDEIEILSAHSITWETIDAHHE
ncbi:MAG: hypothetical protein F6K07_32985 [Okeania sp. SIO1H5]|uniref:EboA domain-containing protein n=1 Tax=Okeania sp. SIO1H5 TaxID=2607777 RepID=UPI0013BA47A0|nr:EboA domain-containing protein [Okeania sp. SIO1H5]NET23809.1 hypothetical protein [Okeania sp. SIO1H5]